MPRIRPFAQKFSRQWVELLKALGLKYHGFELTDSSSEIRRYIYYNHNTHLPPQHLPLFPIPYTRSSFPISLVHLPHIMDTTEQSVVSDISDGYKPRIELPHIIVRIHD